MITKYDKSNIIVIVNIWNDKVSGTPSLIFALKHKVFHNWGKYHFTVPRD